MQREITDARERILNVDRFPQGHLDHASSLVNLGLLYAAHSQYSQAEPCYRQAREILLRVVGEEHPTTAECLTNLAVLYEEVGRYSEALPLYERALRIAEDVLGEGHALYAVTLNNLAALYYQLGNYVEAISLWKRSMKLLSQAQGQENNAYAIGLTNLATAYDTVGNTSEAIRLHEQALAIKERVLDADHPDLARSLNNLGILYLHRAEFVKALRLLERARSIRKLLGTETAAYAESLHNLASLHERLGEVDRTLDLREQVLELYQNIHGGEHPAVVFSLRELAGACHRMGKFDRAAQLLEQARDIEDRARGKNSSQYLDLLQGLASVYLAQGNLQDALEHLELVRDIVAERAGEFHPTYAEILPEIAALRIFLGDYAEAYKLLQQVIAIREKHFGEVDPELTQALRYQAIVSVYMKRSDDARSLAERASRLQQAYFEKHALRLAEHEMLTLSVGLSHSLDVLLSVTDGVTDELTEVWLQRSGSIQRLIHRRNRLLLAMKESASHLREVYDEYVLTRGNIGKISHEILYTHDREKQDLMRTTMETLTARKDRLERTLSEFVQSEVSPQRVELRDFTARLQDREVLLGIVQYRRFAEKPRSAGPEFVPKTTCYTAFLVAKDSPVKRVELGPAREIDELLETWLTQIPEYGHDRNAGQILAARKLRNLVWEPLEAAFPGCTNSVYVCADGGLNFLPWAALPGREPRSVLLEQYRIALLPYPLWLTDQQLAAPSSTARDLLLVGAVDYGASEAQAVQEDEPRMFAANTPRTMEMEPFEPLTPLEWTSVEIKQIQQLARSADLNSIVTLQQQGATEAALAKWLPKVRWAHLATHGRFVTFRERPSGNDTPLSDLAAWFDVSRLMERNPLSLTGLFLADANQAAKNIVEGRKSIITGENLGALDPRGLDVVVLSACQSAQGRVLQGEGVYGLQRAFHIGGARHVIGSLWNVDDQATSVLMRRFYQNLWGPDPMRPLDALREAQLAMLRHYNMDSGELDLRHTNADATPAYYWAAFTFSGRGL